MPQVLSPPPKSQLHSWGLAIVVGAHGVVREGWLARQALVNGQHASHIRRHCHRPCQAAHRMATLLGPLALTSLVLATSPWEPSGGGDFFLAFSASCYFGAVLGHRLSPGHRKGPSPERRVVEQVGSKGSEILPEEPAPPTATRNTAGLCSQAPLFSLPQLVCEDNVGVVRTDLGGILGHTW